MHAIMTAVDSAKLTNFAQDLSRWILDQALDGIGPLPSASVLASDYRHQSYPNGCRRSSSGLFGMRGRQHGWFELRLDPGNLRQTSCVQNLSHFRIGAASV